MLISPVSLKQYNTNISQKRPENNSNLKYQFQLEKDTVSFTGGRIFPASTTTMTEFLEKQFSKQEGELLVLGTQFLNAIESIARKLEPLGVSFDRDFFEPYVVKSSKTRAGKVLRTKSFDDRDAIRTTLYVRNPYDLSVLFEHIIPMMKLSGYRVATIQTPVETLIEKGYLPIKEDLLMAKFFTIKHTKESHAAFFRELKKQGYDYDKTKKMLAEYLKAGNIPSTAEEYLELVKSLEKSVDDIDIRLENDKIASSTIPKDKKYLIGEPHNKYEDIQLRFIREADKEAENPTYHELLIQFGPNYNRNARIEHERVYEPLRMFKKLRMPLIETSPGDQANMTQMPEAAVSKYISEIKGAFRSKISEKLFYNGKNIDYYGDPFQRDVHFTDFFHKGYDKLFELIDKKIAIYYSKLEAANKKNPEKIQQIKRDKKYDRTLISQIKKALDETIKAFEEGSITYKGPQTGV